MKLLTLNTHAWMEDEPKVKLNQIADFISQEDFEIIALQEINQTIEARKVKDSLFISPTGDTEPISLKEDNFALLLVHLLKERGLTYYWSWTANHIGYDKFDEGVAILSKIPFSSESILVSDSADYDNHLTRRVLKATTEINNKEWVVFSCHYSWWRGPEGEPLFQTEWDNTLPHIQPEKERVHLLMGDFNNEASISGEGYTYLKETAPELIDAHIEAEEKVGSATVLSDIDGWEGHTDEKRIDYVFTDYTEGIQTCRVVFDGKKEPVVSDHFGVAVTLK